MDKGSQLFIRWFSHDSQVFYSWINSQSNAIFYVRWLNFSNLILASQSNTWKILLKILTISSKTYKNQIMSICKMSK